ncbi:MAG: exodeoxyribonuclease VII large subunit, partial [Dehalococcoidia bacterium]|nr:exodeoxyribonuclease VII large subunit [Dehalococcoidia bacterium]
MRNYRLHGADAEVSRVAEPFPADGLEPSRRALTVSELTRQIKELFEGTFAYSVLVEGELSDPKLYPSGHLWFDLKDSSAALKCVMWKESVRAMKFQPEQGLQVICSGRVEFYAPRGEVKFSVRSIEPKGRGALQLAFEQLKEKLQKEGLFSEERKRPLPAFPQRVGLVTSPQGAAIDDMLRILRGEVEVLLKPSR